MPIVVTLVLMFAYVIFGAAVMKMFERDWEFIEAVYFSWITLSTIGLGDFVPGKDKTILSH